MADTDILLTPSLKRFFRMQHEKGYCLRSVQQARGLAGGYGNARRAWYLMPRHYAVVPLEDAQPGDVVIWRDVGTMGHAGLVTRDTNGELIAVSNMEGRLRVERLRPRPDVRIFRPPRPEPVIGTRPVALRSPIRIVTPPSRAPLRAARVPAAELTPASAEAIGQALRDVDAIFGNLSSATAVAEDPLAAAEEMLKKVEQENADLLSQAQALQEPTALPDFSRWLTAAGPGEQAAAEAALLSEWALPTSLQEQAPPSDLSELLAPQGAAEETALPPSLTAPPAGEPQPSILSRWQQVADEEEQADPVSQVWRTIDTLASSQIAAPDNPRTSMVLAGMGPLGWLQGLLGENPQVRDDVRRVLAPNVSAERIAEETRTRFGAGKEEEEEQEPGGPEPPPGRFGLFQRILLILGTPQRLISQAIMRNLPSFRNEPGLARLPFMRASTRAWLKRALWPKYAGDEATFLDAFLARAARNDPAMLIRSPGARLALGAIAGLALDFVTDPLVLLGFGTRMLRTAEEISGVLRGSRAAEVLSELQAKGLAHPDWLGRLADSLAADPNLLRSIRYGEPYLTRATQQLTERIVASYADAPERVAELMGQFGPSVQQFVQASLPVLRQRLMTPLWVLGRPIAQAARWRDRLRIAVGLPGIDYTMADALAANSLRERIVSGFKVLFGYEPLRLWASEQERLLAGPLRKVAAAQQAAAELAFPEEVAREVAGQIYAAQRRTDVVWPTRNLPRAVTDRLRNFVSEAKMRVRELHRAVDDIYAELSDKERRALTLGHYLYGQELERQLANGVERAAAEAAAREQFERGAQIALGARAPEQAAAALILDDATRSGRALEPWEKAFLERLFGVQELPHDLGELQRRLTSSLAPLGEEELKTRLPLLRRAFERQRTMYDQMYKYVTSLADEMAAKGIELPVPRFREAYTPIRERDIADQIANLNTTMLGGSARVGYTYSRETPSVVAAIAQGRQPVLDADILMRTYVDELYRYVRYAEVSQIIRDGAVHFDELSRVIPGIPQDVLTRHLLALGWTPVVRITAPAVASEDAARWVARIYYNASEHIARVLPDLTTKQAQVNTRLTILGELAQLLGREGAPAAERAAGWSRESLAELARELQQRVFQRFFPGGIADNAPEELHEAAAWIAAQTDAVLKQVLRTARQVRLTEADQGGLLQAAARALAATYRQQQDDLAARLVQANELLERMGLRNIQTALDSNFVGYLMPPQLAEQVQRMFRESETVRIARTLADWALIPYMRSNLLFSVGFHVRNFIDNWIAGRFLSGELIRSLTHPREFINNAREALAGVAYHYFVNLPMLPPAEQQQRLSRMMVWALEKLAPAGETTAERLARVRQLVQEAYQHGVVSTGMASFAAAAQRGSQSVVSRLLEAPIAREYGKLLNWNTALGQFLEDWPRLITYIFYRKQGYAPASAAEMVARAYPVYRSEIYNPVMAVLREFTTFLPWWESRTRQVLADAYREPWRYVYLLRAYGAATRMVDWDELEPYPPHDQFLLDKGLRGRLAYLRTWIPIEIRYDENGHIAGPYGRALEMVAPTRDELNLYYAGQQLMLMKGQRVEAAQLRPRAWVFVRPALSPLELAAAFEQLLDGSLEPLKDLLASPLIAAGEVAFEREAKPGTRGLGTRLREAAQRTALSYAPMPYLWRAWRYHARPSIEELTPAERLWLTAGGKQALRRMARLKANDIWGEKSAVRSLLSALGLSLATVTEYDLLKNLPMHLRDEWLDRLSSEPMGG